MDTTTNAAGAGSLTRVQVAKVLDISVAGVRRREGTSLHPELGPKGEHLFDVAEVDALRQAMAKQPEPPEREPAVTEPGEAVAGGKPVALPVPVVAENTAVAAIPTSTPVAGSSGEMAASAFTLFEAGKTPAEVVFETKIAPDSVEKLYASWLRLRAMDETSTSARSRIDDVGGSVEGLRIQMAVRLGERGHEIDRVAQQLRDLESRVGNMMDQADAAELHESMNGLLGNVLAMSARLVNAERALGWCVKWVEAMTRQRYG